MENDEEKKKTAGEEGTEGQDSGTETEEEAIDYKALLEEERKLAEAREKELSQAQFKIEQLKKKKKSEATQTEEEEKDETIDVAALIKQEVGKFQTVLLEDKVNDEIGKSSADADEAALIKYHLDHSIQKSGDLKKDIARAKLLANQPRFEKNMREISESLKSKKGKSNGETSGHAEPGDVEVKLSPADEALLKRRGLSAKDVKLSN